MTFCKIKFFLALFLSCSLAWADVKIDNLSHDLKGIAKIDGKVTFISNALLGEVVDIIK